LAGSGKKTTRRPGGSTWRMWHKPHPVPGGAQRPARSIDWAADSANRRSTCGFGHARRVGLILLVFTSPATAKLVQPANMITRPCRHAVSPSSPPAWCWSSSRATSTCRSDRSSASSRELRDLDDRLVPRTSSAFPRNVPPPVGARVGTGIGIGRRGGSHPRLHHRLHGVPSVRRSLGGLLSIRGLIWYAVAGGPRYRPGPTFQLIAVVRLDPPGE